MRNCGFWYWGAHSSSESVRNHRFWLKKSWPPNRTLSFIEQRRAKVNQPPRWLSGSDESSKANSFHKSLVWIRGIAFSPVFETSEIPVRLKFGYIRYNQGVTTHDIWCKDILDIRLIFWISDIRCTKLRLVVTSWVQLFLNRHLVATKHLSKNVFC